MRRRRAFTLLELLVVIAIIAILAAFLFPVMAQVRSNTQQSSCQSRMAEIIRAAKMYKDDWRVYPDVLFKVQTGQDPVTQCPIYTGRLYPEYMRDASAFRCPASPLVRPASQCSDPAGVAVMHPTAGVNTVLLHANSSYDFGYLPNNAGTELHYSQRWEYPFPQPPQPPDARQLMFKVPPDNTVVTWCKYHPHMAVVGFLSGRVQTIPHQQLPGWADPARPPWKTSPKP